MLRFEAVEPRYRPVRGSGDRSIKLSSALHDAALPQWSTDPCLADAFMRLWVRWAHGVPVSWTREECIVLAQVVSEGAPAVWPVRLGAGANWDSARRAGSWTWSDAALLGYLLDSVSHRFSCNLGHQESFKVLALAGRACAPISLFAEAQISHRMYTAWCAAVEQRLSGLQRLELARSTAFPWPYSDYRARASEACSSGPEVDTEAVENVAD